MAGIYIHIPFCKQACHYCNFHFAASLKHKDGMVQAIIKEIELTPYFDGNKKTEINTVYFGGGTPSILSIADLKAIFAALHKKFNIAKNAEVTLEANPDDIAPDILKEWLKTGINRLSVGIQSFDDAELLWMHRVHTGAAALQCIDEIQQAGFTNFSIDLIYGSPLLTTNGWKKNVGIVIEKKIPHISCYALTVEPKTPLQKLISLHKKENVDADKQAHQFSLLMKWMKNAGYSHYEISNFALPGMHSRHNSSYWNGEYYYGFGPSAHSYDGKCRRWNIANNNIYMLKLSQHVIPFEEETLTPTQQLNEYIMTALRTADGLQLDYVNRNFGNDKVAVINKESAKWIQTGKLSSLENKLVLTDKGKLFADGIAASLFF